ncbi:MAG: hypothetical protein OXI87_13140 [Albidovulum sp.]|nr:hypothetical protein [Albidovulum sp.]MDE0534401.1 hypothetical protein [Albidovulum sp.]
MPDGYELTFRSQELAIRILASDHRLSRRRSFTAKTTPAQARNWRERSAFTVFVHQAKIEERICQDFAGLRRTVLPLVRAVLSLLLSHRNPGAVDCHGEAPRITRASSSTCSFASGTPSDARSPGGWSKLANARLWDVLWVSRFIYALL